ncbi:MAG TPA: hypothetical protein VJM83_01550 [Nitrospirota bacterium]|nr:hypothetical protein [Nitrospirota bacterium]
MALLASIDVGSNTVRLLVAEAANGRIVREALNLREITRVGEGLKKGGRLNAQARARTLAVLKDYAARLKELGVEGVSAVATEALRVAADSAAFIADVRDETGLEIEIISGEEEARRTLKGVKAGIGGLGYEGKKLLVDIGGGSTEFILTADWEGHKSISLPLGAVSLYERFLVNDPPTTLELAELENHCFGQLSPLDRFLGEGRPSVLVGTAGTITTLAAVDMAMDAYDPVKVTGHAMKRETVAVLMSRFAGLPKENRKLLAGLEPGREDIILSGTVLLGTIMDRAKADGIVVCDFGLREGNLLYYLEKIVV